jgi:3-oxoacyl-[acyl-carrier-protein] synthase-3
MYSKIVGSGSFIPPKKILNQDFLDNKFYDSNGELFQTPNQEIIKKFESITGIKERRYIEDNMVTSDIAFLAAKDALESSNFDPESLDYIIVAHNFGDVSAHNIRSDLVPSLASRVKIKLGIKNPKTIAYDLPFGCPGWLQGIIQSDYYLKSGDAKRSLVIGAETLSRISDPHDRDSMIYSDGAGATILEAVTCSDKQGTGILSHSAGTYTEEVGNLLRMGSSNKPDSNKGTLYLKMNGHMLYRFALKAVPLVVKESIDEAGLTFNEIDKILLHQANEKMDMAILERLAKICGVTDIPFNIMPMTISWLGNSSVATLPTLLDLLLKNKLNNHKLKEGSVIVFASVGAGMNINSVVYRL